MQALTLTFNKNDATERGCLFVSKEKKATVVYLRTMVENRSTVNVGLARLFLTRIERVDNKGDKVLVCDDTFPLNWACSSGADQHFYPGFEHYADIARFTLCTKGAFEPMIIHPKAPAYWAKELAKPGIYRLHLLLTGPAIKATLAVLELRWPMKKLSGENFSFSEIS